MTKKAKIEQFDAVARERDLLSLAVYDLMNDQVTWSGWHKESDSAGKYRAGVSRLDHTALLLITFRHPGQGDSTSVYDFYKERDNIRQMRQGSEVWEPVVRAIEEAYASAKAKQERAA